MQRYAAISASLVGVEGIVRIFGALIGVPWPAMGVICLS
jgi:hypothetical protein